MTDCIRQHNINITLQSVSDNII